MSEELTKREEDACRRAIDWMATAYTKRERMVELRLWGPKAAIGYACGYLAGRAAPRLPHKHGPKCRVYWKRMEGGGHVPACATEEVAPRQSPGKKRK